MAVVMIMVLSGVWETGRSLVTCFLERWVFLWWPYMMLVPYSDLVS